jgi:hypothetical protein
MLAGRCRRRIICIGACGALDQGGQLVDRFLEATGALAVCGDTKYVDWMTSTAFELMLLALLQENAPTIGGMRAARKKVRAEAATLARNPGFHMAICKRRARNATP